MNQQEDFRTKANVDMRWGYLLSNAKCEELEPNRSGPLIQKNEKLKTES